MSRKKKPYRNEFLINMFKKRIYPANSLSDQNADAASNLLFFMNEENSVRQVREANMQNPLFESFK